MKPAPCHLCGRAPIAHSTPFGDHDEFVTMTVQCRAHLVGQVNLMGTEYAAVHRAAMLAWNDYQDTMNARGAGAAA